MRGFLFDTVDAGAPSQARNPQRDLDLFGFTAGGLQITNSNGAHALSGYSSLGTTTDDLMGLMLTAMTISGTSIRAQIRIRLGGSTVIVQDLQFKINTSTRQDIFIPLQIPTGTLVEIAMRTHSNGASCYFAAKGVVANSLDSPGFTAMTPILAVDTANTQPSATTVADDGAWVELDNAVSADYDAFMVMVGSPASAPTNGQRSSVYLSTGTAGNEDASIFWQDQFNVTTSLPYMSHTLFNLIEHRIPSGSRVSMKIVGPASAPDSFPVNVYLFS